MPGPSPRPASDRINGGGFYRPSRHGRPEDEFRPEGPLRVPEGLDPAVLAKWQEMVGLLGPILTQADGDQLAALANWICIRDKLLAAAAGGDVEAVNAADKASKQVTTLGAKFGMTPVDRAKVKTVAPMAKTPGVARRNRYAGPGEPVGVIDDDEEIPTRVRR